MLFFYLFCLAEDDPKENHETPPGIYELPASETIYLPENLETADPPRGKEYIVLCLFCLNSKETTFLDSFRTEILQEEEPIPGPSHQLESNNVIESQEDNIDINENDLGKMHLYCVEFYDKLNLLLLYFYVCRSGI